jgi:hypothetical protein
VRLVFDRRWVPVVSVLLIAQALAVAVVAPSSQVHSLLWVLSTALGAFGVALVLLRRRWSYARIFLSGFLLACAPIAVMLFGDSSMPLHPYFGRLFDVVWILFLGAICAGGWHFFFGPLVIDKSAESAQSNRR